MGLVKGPSLVALSLPRMKAAACPPLFAVRSRLGRARRFNEASRLWRDQGKRDEARELLAPVYGWFTEGFDTRDLRDGKALLELDVFKKCQHLRQDRPLAMVLKMKKMSYAID